MKIKSIRAAAIDLEVTPKTPPRSARKPKLAMARPTSRYPGVKEVSAAGLPPAWKRTACVVTAEDGTWGLGISLYSGPVVSIINDHFAPHLVGDNPLATEKLWDLMVRLAMPYGSGDLTAYAISAVDTALWDLKGKLLGRPVYELLGGPQKDRIPCYATGFDTEWYVELGFKATKLFVPYGPTDGIEGIRKTEELVAGTRELIGDDVELAVDCWMGMDVETTVRLAETLRPYRLKWLEDYIAPDDLDGYTAVRQRLPWLTLASGEHWYLPRPFLQAANRRVVDIFQPDVLWVGGITAAVKICHIAEAAGVSVIPHASMNYPYGQHLAFAMPAIPLGERSEGVSPPGVPLAEMTRLPGTPAIQDGYLVPSAAPGFGLEVTLDWLEAAAARA
jgi:L-rhamnonate dehydratase